MFVVICWIILLSTSDVVPNINALLREDPVALTHVRQGFTEISPKTIERASKFLGNKPKASEPSWPCPAADLIIPCTCESNEENYEVDIDCSAANNEDEIKTAFSSVFPFDDVMYFTINDPETVNSISKLTEGIFDVKSFGSIEIVGTMLETIEDNVLEYSHPTLFMFTLSDNKLQNFPFQTMNLYDKLISLNLNNNELKELPIFFSSTLRILSMNSNENLEFQRTAETFVGIPALRQLFLSNIGLKTLVPNMFRSLDYISDIYLSGNFLVELDMDTFNTPNPTLQMLSLADNMISTVRSGAITGLSPDGILDLTRNNITVLDQEIWEPIFEQVLQGGSVVLNENPLTCGCDFKWIVNNDNYWNLISSGSTCYAGVLVSEIDKDFIVQNCS